MKVFVYFNLHKKCFSIRSLEGPERGRVIAHRHIVFLKDVVFKVSEAGRQRVLREKRKNVHAGVVGQWHFDLSEQDLSLMYRERLVRYNPYLYSSFVLCHEGTITPVYSASQAYLFNGQVYI